MVHTTCKYYLLRNLQALPIFSGSKYNFFRNPENSKNFYRCSIFVESFQICYDNPSLLRAIFVSFSLMRVHLINNGDSTQFLFSKYFYFTKNVIWLVNNLCVTSFLLVFKQTSNSKEFHHFMKFLIEKQNIFHMILFESCFE